MDAANAGAPWLGMKIADVDSLDRMLLVGSFLRKDHPLLAARIRQAVRRGAQVSVLHASDDDLLMPVASKAIVAPSRWPEYLASILVALLQAKGEPVPASLGEFVPGEEAKRIAAGLLSGSNKAVLLGNAAVQCDRYAIVAQLAQAIADAAGARLGHLGEGANSVGGMLAGAVPGAGGRNAREMAQDPLAAYLLLGVEPTLDHGMPGVLAGALAQAETVIALTSYRSERLMELADCLLPIAPFTETSGTFVNCEGLAQSFNGVVRPLGDSRPAWKVLRVLGNLLELPGFDFDSPEAVRDAALREGIEQRLQARVATDASGWKFSPPAPLAAGEVERLADVPIYFADPIVRRATSLQETRDARKPRARMSSATMARLGLAHGDLIRVDQGSGHAVVDVELDEAVADGVLRLATAHATTAGLASMFGAVRVAKA